MAIFRFFKMAAARHVGFSKFQIVNGGDGQEGQTTSPCQILLKSAQTRPRYRDFSIFQDGGRRHLGFWKFQIFNSRGSLEGRTASSCQISSKSVQPRLKYGDFWIFYDGGRRHLGFSKFQIFNCGGGQEGRTTSKVGRVTSDELRHCAKFRRNRSKRGRDMKVLILC